VSSPYQLCTFAIWTIELNRKVSVTGLIFRAEDITVPFVQPVWRGNSGKTPSNVINERVSFCCLQRTHGR